jgi:hypothetical protein
MADDSAADAIGKPQLWYASGKPQLWLPVVARRETAELAKEELLEIVDGLTFPAFVLTSSAALAKKVCKQLAKAGHTGAILQTEVSDCAAYDYATDALVLAYDQLAAADSEHVYAVAPPPLLPLAGAAQLVVFGAQNMKTDYLVELALEALEQNPDIDVRLFLYGKDDDESFERKLERLDEYSHEVVGAGDDDECDDDGNDDDGEADANSDEGDAMVIA